ncbi:MAG: 50S ribosomal protein L32 [Patescibacteria group bacterium]
MAPLPKRRHSTRRGGKRKASIKLSLLGLMKCVACGAWKMPHRVCKKCGVYNGKTLGKLKKVKKAKK